MRSLTVPADRVPDWAALREAGAFGGWRRSVDIAGLCVHLDGLSEAQARWFDARYGVFASDGERRRDGLRIAVRRGDANGFLQLRASGESEIYRLAQERSGTRVRAWSYRFAGWFDAPAGEGELGLSDEGGRGFESSLENFLRAVYAHLALDHDGFLLHAAGVVKDGRAYLFFGPSGSGKTTVAGLADGGRVVSDDLILVLPGVGDRPAAVSIPFRGHQAELPAAQASFGIAGLYRLVKDRRVALEAMGPARAVSEIAGSLPFVTDRPENGARVLEVVGRAVEVAPVFRLHFRKDASFWEVVLGSERRSAGERPGRL
jgi:hypothetical protein